MDSYKEFAYIYDDLINGDINYESWAEVIINICEELAIINNNYLDLACGTGNLTELLVPYFKNSWGVDLSEEMLMKADEKLRNKKLKAKFICQDITKLNLNKKFNLITCCLDAANYITNISGIESFFMKVNEHLEEKGVFIFDMNTYYKLKEVIGNNTFTYCDDDFAYIWENFDENDDIHMCLTFFAREGKLYNRFNEEHIERAYKDEEILGILSKCGLKIKYKLDNYSSSIICDNTERITYIVVKQ
jgi:SAM-dependent methyltransferase